MKLLVVVMTCQRNKHLWDTILSRIGPDCILFAGGYEKTELVGSVLQLECNDKYDGLPEKVILMLQYLYESPMFTQYTHILKIDDHDVYCDRETISRIINNPVIEKEDYCGNSIYSSKYISNIYHYGKVPKTSIWHNRPFKEPYPFSFTYAAGGAGYILSQKAIRILLKRYNRDNIDYIRNTDIYEDHMIGRLLIFAGIKPLRVALGIKTGIAPPMMPDD